MTPESQGLTLEGSVPGRALWRLVWTFVRPHRRSAALGFVLGLTATLILLSYPLLYAALIDDLVSGRQVDNAVLMITLVAVLTGAHLVVRTAQARAVNRLTASMGEDLQAEMFDRLQQEHHGFFRVSNSGAINARANDEAASAAPLAAETVNFLVFNVAPLVLISVVLIVLDWRSVFLVLFVVLAGLATRRHAHRFRSAAFSIFLTTARQKSYSVERLSVGGNLLTKLLGSYDADLDDFRGLSRQSWSDWERKEDARALSSNIVTFAVNVVALLLLVGLLTLGDTQVGLGTVVAMVVYLRFLEAPLAGMTDARLSIAGCMIAFSRIAEVLDGTRRADPSRTMLPAGGSGRLVFDDVSFVYPPRRELAVIPSVSLIRETSPDNPPSVRGLSFSIAPGETVALAGPSGAGKSTVAMLAAGILEPSQGSVTLDGLPPADRLGLREPGGVAFVTQDAFLFHDTLRSNVLLARPDAAEEELIGACMAAGVHEFAWDFPLRYQTVVGENGQRLSGGERQRIALARALLAQPGLVILDEATAHLDAGTEHRVWSALEERLADRSVLIVAHRYSTLRRADRVVVLHEGRLIEQGTPESLSGSDGLYADLERLERSGSDASPRVDQ